LKIKGTHLATRKPSGCTPTAGTDEWLFRSLLERRDSMLNGFTLVLLSFKELLLLLLVSNSGTENGAVDVVRGAGEGGKVDWV